jgi:hypothetical protein
MNFHNDSNKFFQRDRSDELDKIKEIRKLIDSFNEKHHYHYLLQLKYGLRRAWCTK